LCHADAIYRPAGRTFDWSADRISENSNVRISDAIDRVDENSVAVGVADVVSPTDRAIAYLRVIGRRVSRRESVSNATADARAVVEALRVDGVSQENVRYGRQAVRTGVNADAGNVSDAVVVDVKEAGPTAIQHRIDSLRPHPVGRALPRDDVAGNVQSIRRKIR